MDKVALAVVPDLVLMFSPRLQAVAATFRPFERVITGWSAGPQPDTKFYNPAEPEWFSIEFSYEGSSDSYCHLTVSLDPSGRNPYHTELLVFHKMPDDEWFSEAEGSPSLESIWEHLRQLPRPVLAFTGMGDANNDEGDDEDDDSVGKIVFEREAESASLCVLDFDQGDYRVVVETDDGQGGHAVFTKDSCFEHLANCLDETSEFFKLPAGWGVDAYHAALKARGD